MSTAIEFNPDCRIEVRQLCGGSALVIVDDALLDPEQLVELGRDRLSRLAPDERWHYPGIELPLPDNCVDPCVRFMRSRLREYFGLSRIVREAYARLSMVTLPPEQLSWSQRMCHIDVSRPTPGERVIASVLYLFRDSELGGTAFFKARPEVPPYVQFLQEGQPAPGSEAFEFFRQAPSYHTGSNEFFELDQVVTARWNRMIFYRGDCHHSAHITAPARLSRDPGEGRLTLNGFYRAAAIDHYT